MSDALKQYLTSGQLARRYNKSTRTITRWAEDLPNGFPSPIEINGRKLWDADAIGSWERALAAASRQTKEAA